MCSWRPGPHTAYGRHRPSGRAALTGTSTAVSTVTALVVTHRHRHPHCCCPPSCRHRSLEGLPQAHGWEWRPGPAGARHRTPSQPCGSVVRSLPSLAGPAPTRALPAGSQSPDKRQLRLGWYLHKPANPGDRRQREKLGTPGFPSQPQREPALPTPRSGTSGLRTENRSTSAVKSRAASHTWPGRVSPEPLCLRYLAGLRQARAFCGRVAGRATSLPCSGESRGEDSVWQGLGDSRGQREGPPPGRGPVIVPSVAQDCSGWPASGAGMKGRPLTPVRGAEGSHLHSAAREPALCAPRWSPSPTHGPAPTRPGPPRKHNSGVVEKGSSRTPARLARHSGSQRPSAAGGARAGRRRGACGVQPRSLV